MPFDDRDQPLDDATKTYFAPLGCGRFLREQLELAAIARHEKSVVVDERVAAHLVICSQCSDAVQRLDADNALLSELAGALKPRGGGREGAAAAPSPEESGPIPGYRIGDELHRGGQGAVFMAEQLATRRRCAVKMLLGGRFASPMQRVRFEREVEVVAALRHPSIVTLYESGISTGGSPWFAMEFVEGERLDHFVARTRPSARALVELFLRIADAIAYAHRRGVIHRDLKPGNILVDKDGVPRVLDFGLARAESEQDAKTDPKSGTTLAGEFLGTFAYAAPEQLSGDPSTVDSRCDLYALGVVLYECLAGRKPFENARSIAEVVEQKLLRTPVRPSEVRRETLPRAEAALDSDLDVIAIRLLAADPSRRYDTADALAEDLTRHLEGRPILAREDSVTYVLRRTLRRNWIPATAAALVVVTLLGAGIALAFAYANAERERDRAEKSLRAFRDALESIDPELGQGSSAMNVGEFLALVEQQVDTDLVEEPELLAGILRTIGLVHLGFERMDLAAAAIERAHALALAAHEAGRGSDVELADASIALAMLRFNQGDFDAAEADYRRTVELRERALGPNSMAAVDALRQLASTKRAQGRLDLSRAALDEALRRAKFFPDGRASAITRAAVLNGSGVLWAAQRDDLRALADFEAALAQVSRFVDADDFRIGRTLASIASAEERLGRFDSALANAERSLAIIRQRKGDLARSTKRGETQVARISAKIAARDGTGAGGDSATTPGAPTAGEP